MTRFIFLGVAAFLSTAIATPVLAQAVIQEPGAYAFHYPNADLGIGSKPSQRREPVVIGEFQQWLRLALAGEAPDDSGADPDVDLHLGRRQHDAAANLHRVRSFRCDVYGRFHRIYAGAY